MKKDYRILIEHILECMKEKRKKLIKKEEKALLTFLKLNKEGKYAKISEIPCGRIKVRREEPYDEYYYYSVR